MCPAPTEWERLRGAVGRRGSRAEEGQDQGALLRLRDRMERREDRESEEREREEREQEERESGRRGSSDCNFVNTESTLGGLYC